MKKRRFIFLLSLCICVIFINFEALLGSKVVNKIQKENKVDYKVEEENISENIPKIVIEEEQIFHGNLLLVNSEIPVQQESIKSDIVNLSAHNELTIGFKLLDNEIYLSEEIAHRFSEMIAGAEQDGVTNFSINSGYRDFEKQSRIYQEMGSAYALPAGHSEHNLGLSIDVGSTQMKMADAPEGKWIENNAWKYGFILRYPRDKMDVTGIQFEPWHIRYVGLPHSAIMKENNFALEEYLDFLKAEKQINTSNKGKNYTVTYYPISKSREINLNDQSNYEISGNNMDGVIVTVYE
ncbi:VanY-A/VanY-F/VanY-M family D-Ala-D-Ala carboxypeptidase [Bacillus sp. AFS041924]|uniref:VanY-A/VanY-F/VanY-M family D-Ala-D-Ala carboxypeptidase n=1 Tax=Bacillus sp. AFS041924 TaxID=2033503 RepID=UPI000BFC2921|nr:VanY-A/VanY-F/VanY-M family D-Ala-D-Ala carboxypeptidase [Bacillus sp. AFS041924]PGS46075.1 D-Ala-D-Ala carboxypeptidase VanY [Bacillus sp. AFS041924]